MALSCLICLCPWPTGVEGPGLRSILQGETAGQSGPRRLRRPGCRAQQRQRHQPIRCPLRLMPVHTAPCRWCSRGTSRPMSWWRSRWVGASCSSEATCFGWAPQLGWHAILSPGASTHVSWPCCCCCCRRRGHWVRRAPWATQQGAQRTASCACPAPCLPASWASWASGPASWVGGGVMWVGRSRWALLTQLLTMLGCTSSVTPTPPCRCCRCASSVGRTAPSPPLRLPQACFPDPARLHPPAPPAAAAGVLPGWAGRGCRASGGDAAGGGLPQHAGPPRDRGLQGRDPQPEAGRGGGGQRWVERVRGVAGGDSG